MEIKGLTLRETKWRRLYFKKGGSSTHKDAQQTVTSVCNSVICADVTSAPDRRSNFVLYGIFNSRSWRAAECLCTVLVSLKSPRYDTAASNTRNCQLLKCLHVSCETVRQKISHVASMCSKNKKNIRSRSCRF